MASEENGVWCCSQHGTLIDKNQGFDYSADLLFAWKRLAEARALKRLDDAPSPLGWVSSITLSEFPSNRLEGLDVGLSRLTLLGGGSGSGKTTLMQVACGVSRSAALHRFSRQASVNNAAPIRVEGGICYTTVDSLDRTAMVSVLGGAIARSVDGVRSNLPPDDVVVVGWHDVVPRQSRVEDDLDYLMRVIDEDDSSLRTLIKALDRELTPWNFEFEQANEVFEEQDGTESARPLYKENGQPYLVLIATKFVQGRAFDISFGGLSSSERGRVEAALMIAKARELARRKLTLLVLDEVASSFDDDNFERLLRVLARQEFQSLVCMPAGFVVAAVDQSQDPPALHQLPQFAMWRLVWLPGSRERA